MVRRDSDVASSTPASIQSFNHRDAEAQRFTEKNSVYLRVSVSLW